MAREWCRKRVSIKGELHMINVLEKGSNNKVIISLHGTGGHATQLFDISRMIDKNATLLGIEGDVNENGMNRYFERFPDGNYNLESLDQKTEQLYNTIKELITKYELEDFDIFLIGYSNGANMMVNILKNHTLNVKGHMILHPAIMKMNVPYQKQASSIFISSGSQDPYFSIEAMDAMETGMRDAGMDTTSFMSELGHQLIHEEIEAAQAWYQKTNA